MPTGFDPPSSGAARRRVGAVCWLVAPVQYLVAQVVVASGWPHRYSWSANYISDLGNTRCGRFGVPHGVSLSACSPLHVIMNASFVVGGLLTLTGALLLWRSWPPRRLATAGSWLLVANGMGKVLVGLSPENVNTAVHAVGAFNIPAGSTAMLLFGLALRRTIRVFGTVSVVAGLVALIAFVLFGVGQYLGLGIGGMERLAEYPAELWLIVGAVVASWLARGTSGVVVSPWATSPPRG